MSTILIKTPGRVCLYGDHQDYLGLPVIACAIDRFIELKAKPINEPELRVHLPDLGKERIIPLSAGMMVVENNDHLTSGLKVIRDLGVKTDRGYQITISGNLPINAGVSSSSAVMVAWMHFLSEAYLQNKLTPEHLGQLAYQAEVVEHNSPGGNMDQLTIACGGLVHIETIGQGKVNKLDQPQIGLVLGVSGIPKTTLGTLGSNREKAEAAIKYVKTLTPEFKLESCRPCEVPDYKKLIPADHYPVFEAAVANHQITRSALAELKKESPDINYLGDLMWQHHALLRDNLKLSTSKIENILQAAAKSGATGGKIVGSGGGGCVVALCKPGQQTMIADAMKMAGAKDAFSVSMANGSKKL